MSEIITNLNSLDLLGFIDARRILVILHLFGLALGAGGAFASDWIFFTSIKDEIISKTESLFLKLSSRMVWTGLLLLIFSGLMIVLLQPERYGFSNVKFWAKMTVVTVIFLNGLIFHFSHLPRILKHSDMHFPSSKDFVKKAPILFISGSISFVSWSMALILGALRGVPYSYGQIMLVYLSIIIIAAITAFLIFKGKYKKWQSNL